MSRRMKRMAVLALGVFAVTALSGCEKTKEAVGLTRQSPDEFSVYKRAPLSLPPEYALRPPEPGAPRPQDTAPRNQAMAALTGRRTAEDARAAEAGRGMGELALLRSAGALDVDPQIRQIVNRETSIYAEEAKSFTERIMFWSEPLKYGIVVDAEAEAKRIQENKALGEPLTKGETPYIERRRKAVFEDLFSKDRN